MAFKSTWTKEIPLVDGWYWVRGNSGDSNGETRLALIDHDWRSLHYGDPLEFWTVKVDPPPVDAAGLTEQHAFYDAMHELHENGGCYAVTKHDEIEKFVYILVERPGRAYTGQLPPLTAFECFWLGVFAAIRAVKERGGAFWHGLRGKPGDVGP